jgi:SET domain-containing protein
MERIVVRNSPIHGRGVFAARRIDAGEVIIDWSGCSEVLSDEAVNALPSEERIFVSVIDGQNILFKPPARFVNHSCSPNARGCDRHDIAIRVIEAGEEITVDYIAEQVPSLRLECKCKAPNCRGLLVVPSRPKAGPAAHKPIVPMRSPH